MKIVYIYEFIDRETMGAREKERMVRPAGYSLTAGGWGGRRFVTFDNYALIYT